MRNRFIAVVTVTLGLCANGAGAAEKLMIQTPAVYDNDARINNKIRTECAVENRLSQFMAERASGKYDVVSVKTPDASGKALTLTILNVGGVGGGGWSGPKSITLHGVLKDKGRVIGTFNARRGSSGGAFGAYKSTCGIIERCAEALAKDVSAWLEKPTMDAGLGELEK
jgi:hypothetical protein